MLQKSLRRILSLTQAFYKRASLQYFLLVKIMRIDEDDFGHLVRLQLAGSRHRHGVVGSCFPYEWEEIYDEVRQIGPDVPSLAVRPGLFGGVEISNSDDNVT